MRLIPLLLCLLPFLAQAQTDAPKEGDDGLRIQIFLDQKCFGPGFLDGKPGNFTLRAVYSYNRFKGRSPGAWDALLAEAETEVKSLYATATVPSLATKFINPKLPQKYDQVGGVKLMAYRSYLEFMAERYHTSESYLIELNGKRKSYNLKPRSTLKVPNIEPFRIEMLTVGLMHKTDSKLSLHNIVIDTKNKQLFVYDPSQATIAVPGTAMIVSDEEQEPLGKMIAMFPTTPGQEKFIHRGTWKVVNCVEFPTWRYDKELLKTGKRSKTAIQVAHGPNNPVGVMWCGLSKSGIGIHGTSSPRTIGRALSAGCYRLSNWDAARFPQYVRPGARVIVR
ncbi:MAG: lipoprotein-anchoring transpeptidase ErfK/SrfK [Paracoccaceae bacterium]|jgi:lipoprotein-anchoring transpeptidase ErfK/SrfK